jgi:hypothetical protein
MDSNNVFGHNNEDFRPSLFWDVMQCMQEACNLAKTKSIFNSYVYQNSNHVGQLQTKYEKRLAVLLMFLYNTVTR